MPTRSEPITERATQNGEWGARPARPPRSVFGNYSESGSPGVAPAATDLKQQREAGRFQVTTEPLQTAIDGAMARSFLYRFLAQAYQDPTEENWTRITEASCTQVLDSVVRTLASAAPRLASTAAAVRSQFKTEQFDAFLGAYLAAFGHAARGRCPLNEIEYGDIKADPLFQPHRLADLAAFYRAFGLEVAEDAGERHDHICLELEFMCVLAAKEAYALEHQVEAEELLLCRDAQKRFLREHLGRWVPAFTRRLARLAGDNPLGALANLTCGFVEAECARYGVPAGSEELLLRPTDEAAESACNSCGVTQLPPGALPPGATAV